MKKAVGHDLKPGDSVIFKNPQKKKSDAFMVSNIVGIVEEVLPGGICKVSHGGEEMFVKNVFVGQLVKWKVEGIDVTEKEEGEEITHSAGTLSHLQLVNHITDTSINLRMDFYASKLRRKMKDGFAVFKCMKLAVEAYDHFLLAKLLSNDAEQHTAKYLEILSYLKSVRFPFFLYSTVHWERKRKDNLGPLLSVMLKNEEHQCQECFISEIDCDHSCCRERALNFAIRSGLFKLSNRQQSHCQRKIMIEKPTGTLFFYLCYVCHGYLFEEIFLLNILK